MILSLVCAWCDKELDRVHISPMRYEDINQYLITHGICEDCAKKYFPHQYSLNFRTNEDDD